MMGMVNSAARRTKGNKFSAFAGHASNFLQPRAKTPRSVDEKADEECSQKNAEDEYPEYDGKDYECKNIHLFF